MEIVVRQISGLGNQLFQYAAGRYYAERLGASLRVVIDQPQNAFSHGHPRPFLLSHFQLAAPAAPPSFADRLILSSKPSLAPLAAALRRARRIQVFTEQPAQRFRFLEDLPLEPGVRTLYLRGYWQAHRFADSVAETLRREFTFKHPPQGRNLELLQQIAGCASSVSLHVRRGDYTLAAEGNIALPLAFYNHAIAHFQRLLPSPVFFVFSDDLAFTRAHLPRDLPAVFVEGNDDASSHEDLRLMSACRHHILANSTFSWWGAWLNPRPDKIVYAPKFWHLKPDSFFPDLLPPQWTLGEVPILTAEGEA